ncbi:hypothetical protein [Gordonia shandongensis]|uniref:hypothetical protein n=1 Tax=Gordonia shandongensis TaxID=376351 RepID=UPI0003FB89AF|nr:hypothetical protein [Gordonia shandongensis]
MTPGFSTGAARPAAIALAVCAAVSSAACGVAGSGGPGDAAPISRASLVTDGDLARARVPYRVGMVTLPGESVESVRAEVVSVRPESCRAAVEGPPSTVAARLSLVPDAAPGAVPDVVPGAVSDARAAVRGLPEATMTVSPTGGDAGASTRVPRGCETVEFPALGLTVALDRTVDLDIPGCDEATTSVMGADGGGGGEVLQSMLVCVVGGSRIGVTLDAPRVPAGLRAVVSVQAEKLRRASSGGR